MSNGSINSGNRREDVTRAFKPYIKNWRRVALLGVPVIVIGLLALGAAYQYVGQALDRQAAPPPGRFVQVNGGAIHLHCTGQGKPTVLLEAGATGFAQTWAWIQSDLSEETRVCSYDRAGMGSYG